MLSVNSEPLATAAQSHRIIVAINDGIIEELASLKVDPCLRPDDFHVYPSKDHLLSLNVLCRALKAGNYKFTLDLLSVPNVERGKWLVDKGKAHVLLHLVKKKPMYNSSVDGIVYSEVVRNDELNVSAFFTSVNNQAALAATSLADLQELKAVVPHRWTWQQKQLDGLNIIYYPLQYQQLAKFIKSQRADIVLLDMKGKTPTEKTLFGINLKATGKTYFVESKAVRFALSKNIKGSDKLMSALSVGLKKLKVSGVIDEMFSGLALDKTHLNGWTKVSIPP